VLRPKSFLPLGSSHSQCARGAPGASGGCPRSSSLTSWRPGSSRRYPGSSRRYASLLQGAPRAGWPERRSSRCTGSSPVGGHSHRELAGSQVMTSSTGRCDARRRPEPRVAARSSLSCRADGAVPRAELLPRDQGAGHGRRGWPCQQRQQPTTVAALVVAVVAAAAAAAAAALHTHGHLPLL
jgi:hypothetical protein